MKRTETKLLTPDDKIIKDMIAKASEKRKPRIPQTFTKTLYCLYHPKIQVLRMYLNSNQAKKFHLKLKTNYVYCRRCDDVFLVIDGEII